MTTVVQLSNDGDAVSQTNPIPMAPTSTAPPFGNRIYFNSNTAPAINVLASLSVATPGPNRQIIVTNIDFGLSGADSIVHTVHVREGTVGSFIWSCVIRASLQQSAAVGATGLHLVLPADTGVTIQFDSVASGSRESVSISGYSEDIPV